MKNAIATPAAAPDAKAIAVANRKAAADELARLQAEHIQLKTSNIHARVDAVLREAIAARKFGGEDPRGVRPTFAGTLRVILTKALQGQRVTPVELTTLIGLMPRTYRDGGQVAE